MNYKELFSLEGKCIVITGGLGQIGSEVCLALRDAGACIYMADVDPVRAKTLLSSKRYKGRGITFIPLDITSEKSIECGFNAVLKKDGKIDAFINCAYPRTADWGDPLEKVSAESFCKNLDMHLGGYFLSSRKALSIMRRQKNGSVINFGSIYGVVAPHFDIYNGTGMTMPVAYSAIKAGVVGFSKYLSSYYAKDNLRVNVICPGGVFNNQDPRFVRAYNSHTPMGRMARPQDVVGSVLFLCSDASKYITGQVLMVDGGWSTW